MRSAIANQRRRRNKVRALAATRTAVEGSGMTVPVSMISSSCSAPELLAFQAWMQMVSKLKLEKPSEVQDVEVMVASFE